MPSWSTTRATSSPAAARMCSSTSPRRCRICPSVSNTRPRACLRDRIRALTQIQGHQDINIRELGDADVIAAHQAGGQTCIQVFFFRGGQNWGNRPYYPGACPRARHRRTFSPRSSASSTRTRQPPRLILLSHGPRTTRCIAEALATRAGGRVDLLVPQRGDKRQLVEHALVNAREALGRRLAESSAQQKLLAGVATTFGLEAPPRRIEVYDNSPHPGHQRGRRHDRRRARRLHEERLPQVQHPRASRTPGDDYAMMREVLTRRFSRALKEDPGRDSGNWPDLLLIDGGAGQVTAANAVFADLGIDDLRRRRHRQGAGPRRRARAFLPRRATSR